MNPIIRKHKWALLYLTLVLTAAAFVLYRSLLNPPNPPYFEIINYSGDAEVLRLGSHDWQKINRGDAIGLYDQIRTGEKSDIDFKIPGKALFRIRENTLISGDKKDLFASQESSPEDIRMHLERGVLIGYRFDSEEEQEMIIEAPFLRVLPSRDSVFSIRLTHAGKKAMSWVGVLRGSVEAVSKQFLTEERRTIGELESALAPRGEPLAEPDSLTQKEWHQLKEGYELMERVEPQAQDQMDLSKEAGELFHYVFDHGTFYTPKLGYANREFVEREESGEVILKLDYDVFPVGSFAGMYLKTRDLDLSAFESLNFEIQKMGESGFPASFQIEFKSSSGTIRSQRVHQIQKGWRMVRLPLPFQEPVHISEITLVFANDQVGEHKKGAVAIRNVNLTPH